MEMNGFWVMIICVSILAILLIIMGIIIVIGGHDKNDSRIQSPMSMKSGGLLK